MHLTKSEQQIMEIFWKADHAMAQTEVVSTCVERKWKERSIFSMLNSLMEKGVLREVGFVRSGKTYARTFEPAMSHAEYLAAVVAEQLPAKQLPERWKRPLRSRRRCGPPCAKIRSKANRSAWIVRRCQRNWIRSKKHRCPYRAAVFFCVPFARGVLARLI